MFEFLKEKGASERLANRVRDLIRKHEVGGTHDQNILRDADSLSFLETKTKGMKRRLERGFAKKEVKAKIDYMFNRMTIPKAREVGKLLYEKMLKQLELS